MTNKFYLLLLMVLASCTTGTDRTATSDSTATTPAIQKLALADYRPVSLYNIPVTRLEKAAYPVIDMHSHDYARTREEVDTWVETMQSCGIAKTVILSAETGVGFDTVAEKYSMYPEQFEIWCGLDYTGYDSDPQWTDHAIKELERCHALGAKGVGELGDKGEGLYYSQPTAAYGLHMDDPALRPIWKRCAELGMPVNIHVADPIWMYAAMDSTNDGLMNAWTWRIDLSKENILNHQELMATLDNVAAQNPNTTFIACHFANCSYDLSILGTMLDKHSNLWADISARYAETAPIPRHVRAFYEKYQGRLLYGTDMGINPEMYRITFRILESADEHFYENDQFGYHWPLNGFDLPGEVLEQVYHTNAVKLMNSL
jgi:predicted TIM-barrel fold metal-dependent hydrolase